MRGAMFNLFPGLWGGADHKANQELLASMLRQQGHGYEIVENGQEAVQITATKTYDLILMVHVHASRPRARRLVGDGMFPTLARASPGWAFSPCCRLQRLRRMVCCKGLIEGRRTPRTQFAQGRHLRNPRLPHPLLNIL